jgi:energy-coupling factor transport system substrate-specific component
VNGRTARVLTLVLTVSAGLMAFAWPLIWSPASGLDPVQAPMVFALVLPFVLAVVIAELTGGGMDVTSLALLGVLTAVTAVLRPLSAGTTGIELIFFPLVIAGRVFGAGFGFALGTTALFTSALLTGGVGPWLPYQMIAAGFVGLVAGLLPRASGRSELTLLSCYGAFAAFAYGWLMDFAFWPFGVGPVSQFSFDPTASATENLRVFVLFNLATSMGWNLGRAVTTVVAIALLGPGLLRVLRRVSRRATFEIDPSAESPAAAGSGILGTSRPVVPKWTRQ